MNVFSFLVLVAVIVVSAGAFYVFDLKSSKNTSNTHPSDSIQQERKGRVVFLDPQTGKLTSKPSKNDLKAFQQQRSVNATRAQQPEIEYLADGTVRARLNGRFNQHLIATMDSDGNIKVDHADNADIVQHKAASSVEEGEQ